MRNLLLPPACLLTAIVAACGGGSGDRSIDSSLTPVPYYEDPFGALISCDLGRAFAADEVLVAVSESDADAVTELVERNEFSIESKEDAPTENVWMTVGVPAGWVPAAVTVIESWVGVVSVTPNYVMYSGDVLVDAPRECQADTAS